MALSDSELDELAQAKRLLEHPGLAARLASIVGSPLEKGITLLPDRVQQKLHATVNAVLMKTLEVAVKTLGSHRVRPSSDVLHKIAAAASGAAGGAFGLPALALELPISTGVMLRSIADIAMANGENPREVDTQLACIMVFALGSPVDRQDDAAESAYFAARMALAEAVGEAVKHLARKGFTKASGPPLVRLIALISSRFGIVVSDKVAAQAVPIIGAAGGAIINTVFIDHYQDMARGHFTVRRLERLHGPEAVRLAYEGAKS